MKRWTYLLLTSFVMFAFLAVFSSCAGSKSSKKTETPPAASQDDESYDEIEKLLGITPEDKAGTKPANEDDNLIDLLREKEQKDQKQANTESPKTAGQPPKVEPTKNPVVETTPVQPPKESENVLSQTQIRKNRQQPPVTPVETAPTYSYSPSSGSEYEARYNDALDLFHARRYREAIDQYEALLSTSTTNSLSDNAQYWIGECYYALGDYRAAILAFEKVFTFKNSNKNDFAQYKLGLCYYQLKDRERARQEFQTLVDNYQNSSLISSADKYLSKL